MKRFTLFLLGGFLVLSFILAPAANAALLTYWDVQKGDNTIDTDSLTSNFDQIQYTANTTSFQFDDDGNTGFTAGDSFIDYGNAQTTSLLPFVAGSFDDEGISLSKYEVERIKAKAE